MCRRQALPVLVVIGSISFLQGAETQTWYVDDSVPSSGSGTTWETAFQTIQEGINAASDGDTVIVAPGTYVENILFKGKNIILTSTDPLDPRLVAKTIIDGNESGSAVTFSGREDETCALVGFTVQRGWADYGSAICGGTWDRYTHATIRNNRLVGNKADYRNDGAVRWCAGKILSNTISENEGSGLRECHYGVIQDNRITANLGAGLLQCIGTMRRNVISENCDGGMLACKGTIEGNVISYHRVEGSGAGLLMCSGRIRANLIFGNRASGWYEGVGDPPSPVWNPGLGGGMCSCDGLLENNTIVGNAADVGGGLYKCQDTIRNCVIWANSSVQNLHDCSVPTYSCIQDWTAGGEGNISEDPRFVNRRTGDFRLRTDSPCIDAGFNDPELPETDIASMHRIMFGGKSLTVDMGAYEFYINRVDPVSGTDEAIFTWSSLAGKDYSIFYTDDLFIWHLAVENFPSSGNTTTSWTDDGSLTGLPPPLVPRRFYRVLENP